MQHNKTPQILLVWNCETESSKLSRSEVWSPTQEYLLPHLTQFQYRSASVETAMLEQGRDSTGQQDGVEGKIEKSQHGRKHASARQSAGQGRPSRVSGTAP